MGGSNDLSNIIELTVEEHAEAHRLLWFNHGCIEDRIAWLCLSGRVITDEDRILLAKSGFKKFMSDPTKKSIWKLKISKSRKNQIITEEHKRNISLGNKKAWATGKRSRVVTEKTRALMRNNYQRNKLGELLSNARKSSQKWKDSVSSEEYKQKKRILDPRSKKVSINGVVYDSIRHAAKLTKTPYSRIRRTLNSDANNDIFFC